MSLQHTSRILLPLFLLTVATSAVRSAQRLKISDNRAKSGRHAVLPDGSVIVKDAVVTNVPGAERYRFVATRDQSGTYAMVYVPVSRPFRLRMDAIKGVQVTAWWFNPRTGKADQIGVYKNPRATRVPTTRQR